jgi:hypothetical protein
MRPLSFGRDRPTVAELRGAFHPPPIPPGYRGPPQVIVPPTEIIEPTAGWWRNAGAFGQRYQGPPTAFEGEIIPLTEQLNLPGPPAPWWFQFFRYDRNVAFEGGSPGNWELRALLTYGVGGAQNVIETDIMQGMQFALVCNSVSVALKTYAPIGGAAYGVTPGAEFTAGCMFGKGGAGAGALPVTWTTPQFEVINPDDLLLTFPIPDFARSIALHTTQTVQASLDAVVLTFSGPGGAIKEVVAGRLYEQLSQEKGIAIPGGTNQVQLFAPVATNVGAVFSLQFFLAL